MCKPIPDNFDPGFPHTPGDDDDLYIPTGCGKDEERDCCPKNKNLGDKLSDSAFIDGPYPKIKSNAAATGYDDSIAFFVKGTYTSEIAAEVEGKIVVLGDFLIKSGGVNSLVNAGVGSGVVPKGDQVIMTGK